MFFRLLILFVFAFPVPALAANCYSAVEAEAEQGLRIQSELMVIGLNCQHMGQRYGMNLYGDYRNFVARHNDLFATYESILMSFFQKRGDASPEKSLNTLRTGFANKISNNAASIRPDIFCSNYAPRIEKADAMSREQLRRWAATIHPSHPVSYPLCAGQ